MLNYDCTKTYPDPIIKLVGTEKYSTGAGNFIRYKVTVTNWRQFPNELFVASPDLPPCGLNPNASRTWVNLYDGNDKYLYGFCALKRASQLQDLWFAVRKGVSPPDRVCLKLEDRGCDQVYASECISTRGYDCNVVYPDPKLVFEGTEEYTVPAGTFIRYKYDVLNYSDYPDALFHAAPDLPPCGLNTNSARTWVNFYHAANDSYLYGFCALNKAADLNKIWFAIKKGDPVPREVYIVLDDRGCEKKYRSNLAPTSAIDCEVQYPEPELFFEGTEEYTTASGEFVRYKFDVLNYHAYPDSLFAAAPYMPPCGANTNSSRTWVDFFNADDDSRIYGFCALDSADDLNKIWFAVKKGDPAPEWVYILLNDRFCEKKYRSNSVATAAVDCTAIYPDPILELVGTEEYSTAAGEFVRYLLNVTNKDDYPDELFIAAPDLPPCGANSNAARTWVDIYDGKLNRLYGFCALGNAANLGNIWFAVPKGDTPPHEVYIKLTDRRCEKEYRSNKIEIRHRKGIEIQGPIYTVFGRITDAAGNPVEEAHVEVWDKDLFLADDGLGSGQTDAGGFFDISFNAWEYRDFLFFDRRPDLYFKVYQGEDLVLNTEAEVVMNAEEQDDIFELKLA
jgi:hypothetical protein